MNVAKINPWHLFDELHNDRARYFIHDVNTSPKLSTTKENTPYHQVRSATSWKPNIDIFESDSSFVVSMDLPGVDPNTVDIQVEHNILLIKGNREDKRDKNEKNNVLKIRHNEKTHGEFSRRVQLPKDIDQNKMEAKFKLGILDITINKQEKLKPKKITISAE